jgi:hypothetical protein
VDTLRIEFCQPSRTRSVSDVGALEASVDAEERIGCVKEPHKRRERNTIISIYDLYIGRFERNEISKILPPLG